MRDDLRVSVLPDPQALADEAAAHCLELARAAIAARGVFHIALSGGSTPRLLFERLTANAGADDWRRWQIWFGDERCVPQEHPESNYRAAREALLDHLPIPAAQVHPMFVSGDPGIATEAYSAEMEALLPHEMGVPVLDLVLLGMGEDGHTASLFPGCAALEERRALTATCIAPNGSTRITLTPPVIEAARTVMVLVSGEAKAATMARLLSGEGDELPIARLRPRCGFEWFVDTAAMGGQ